MAIDYHKLYEYRFRDVDQDSKLGVWREIAGYLNRRLGQPKVILDPAAGRCELINSMPSRERWIVDVTDQPLGHKQPEVKFIKADILAAELPADHFDAVLVSNFLEHLPNPDAVAAFLKKMRSALKPGGRILIMGPNFKYCPQEYFDCADHILALTDLAVAEHLYAAGFKLLEVRPRFLPFSFRGRLPPSPFLVRWYLKMPFFWKILGKQFLLVAQR